MKNFESEIKQYAEKTRLKAAEREAIRERVLSYMEYHPLQKKMELTHTHRSFLNRADFIYIPLNSLRMKVFAVAVGIFLVVVIPIAAERAVPGDVLYLVKTGVNEEIRMQLATTPYEKVTLETKLMERRIGEARLLASEGKLTEKAQAHIVETVREHASAVQTGLAEIREDDAEEAALAGIVFSSALEVQSAVLNESGKKEMSSSVEGIIDMVNTVREEVATNVNPTSPSFESLSARIETETTRAYELFETIKESATGEEIRDIERRLSDVNRKIIGARELRDEDETGAVNDMIDALSLTQKLIAFMTDIDIRETVALETLVPVEPTPEERLTALQLIIDEAEQRKIAVEAELPNVEGVGLVEKVTLGLLDLEKLLDTIRIYITEGDIANAELISVELNALADDLYKLVPTIISDVPVIELPEGEIGTTSTPIVATTTNTVIENEGTISTIFGDDSGGESIETIVE